MLKKIVIIGAGQLGSRHLQALASLSSDFEITVVDPSIESLRVAQERYAEVQLPGSPRSQFFTEQPNDKTQIVEVCIIATNAAVRLAALQELVNKVTVKKIVFEKVLFQSVNQMDQAQKLLKNNNIQAWVNCPRRMFPIYQLLKTTLADEKNLRLTVNGDNWGLACNAIHFIDIWAYLTGDTGYQLNLDDAPMTVADSKRPGYKEVFGTIEGDGASGGFSLSCRETAAGVAALSLQIETDNYSVAVNEGQQLCLIKHPEGETKEVPFRILYQSQLTQLVVESLIKTGSCGLTSFDDSYALHAPYLNAMLSVFNKQSDQNQTETPIT